MARQYIVDNMFRRKYIFLQKREHELQLAEEYLQKYTSVLDDAKREREREKLPGPAPRVGSVDENLGLGAAGLPGWLGTPELGRTTALPHCECVIPKGGENSS